VSTVTPAVESRTSPAAPAAGAAAWAVAATIRPADPPPAAAAARGECTCPDDCVRDHPNE